MIDVIDLIPGLPGDLTINRIDTLLMTLALSFFNLKVVKTNAPETSLKRSDDIIRLLFRAEGVHGRIVP